MKERPILFNGDMVRAILDGRKTQERRPVKFQINADPRYVTLTRMQDGFTDGVRPVFGAPDEPNWFSVKSPHGTIGDRLWVRETFAAPWGQAINSDGTRPIFYRADDQKKYESDCAWTPSIHMPRWASRIDLEITGVRVERVQEMEGMDAASSDALKEGVHRIHHEGGNYYYSAFRNQPDPKNWTDPCLAFKELWQSIYTNWDSNPWVWVYEFRRIKL